MIVKLQKSLQMLAFALLIVAVFAVCLYPFAYAVASSLKAGVDLFAPDLWGFSPVFENYPAIFAEQPFGTNILNSALVAFMTVLASLVLAVGAGFVFSRIDFKGRAVLLASVLCVSMFPQVAVLAGLFELVRAMGLYNSIFGLALTYTVFTLPFTIWVLSAYMRYVPAELEEAAIMDGAGHAQIVFQIFMPLLWPALVATGLLAFIGAWNEFLFALTFTLTDDTRTVPVAIALISGNSQYELPWGRIMAASVTVTLPLLVLVAFFERRIISGLTAGAIKG